MKIKSHFLFHYQQETSRIVFSTRDWGLVKLFVGVFPHLSLPDKTSRQYRNTSQLCHRIQTMFPQSSRWKSTMETNAKATTASRSGIESSMSKSHRALSIEIHYPFLLERFHHCHMMVTGSRQKYTVTPNPESYGLDFRTRNWRVSRTSGADQCLRPRTSQTDYRLNIRSNNQDRSPY